MLFFIQTTYFTPINLKKYGFKEIDENTLILEKDNSIWKSIYLYDLGWGKERGYYREPMPPKEALFEMAFPDTFQNNGDGNFNYWGSLSVLIDNHCDYLLERISKEIETSCEFVNKHMKAMKYLNTELNVSDDIIRRLSDKSLAKNCIIWKLMKEKYRIIL